MKPSTLSRGVTTGLNRSSRELMQYVIPSTLLINDMSTCSYRSPNEAVRFMHVHGDLYIRQVNTGSLLSCSMYSDILCLHDQRSH